MPAADQTFYVSSSTGNDANDGLSPSTPKQTLAAVFALVQSGQGDHVLLKAGDIWHEGIPHFIWSGGPSSSDPLVISSYGQGARPLLDTDATEGGIDMTGGGGAPFAFAHVWFVGIDFDSSVRDPSSPDYDAADAPLIQAGGFTLLTSATDIQIEDCGFSYYDNDILIQAPNVTDFRIIGCQIDDAWEDTSVHSQGLYAEGVNNLLVLDSTFDHDGWNADVPAGACTVCYHDLYLSGCSDVTIQGCIISDASNFGIKLTAYQPDTTGSILITGNLFFNDPNALVLGGQYQNADGSFTASNVVVTDNVFTDIGGTAGGVAQSVGIYAEWESGVAITGNYMVNKPDVGQPNELIVQAAPIADLTFIGNTIFNWGGEDGTGSGIINTGTPQSNVVIADNNLDLPASAYVNPTRTVNSYDATLGGPGTTADFIQRLLGQTEANWNPQLTAQSVVAYFAAGFQVVGED